ncbi:N-6 DNA methylase [Clostridium sp. AL.422]|uniref:N-6 DNA methylase n=1 Tax=Clostridium TaxID=1485 RepID=UPI00293DA4B0|nr:MULTISPECIES: N-6 DNA methylase [unclassified Clostridium]MDV4149570.1 N-6 DNA methylase [Clostridium sp. AL.422]
MGRKDKVLIEKISSEEFIDKRLVGYYSTPDFICEYIKKRLLEIKSNGKEVFDPCCGREEMLAPFIKSKIKTFGVDIVKYKEDYSCEFLNKDFLEIYYERVKEDKDIETLNYDYYTLNPPYNCHEVNYIRENKSKLRSLFKDVGIHNMYSMFISAIIDLSKNGAVIGIITQDSFLSSKSYEKLRKKIINNCSIHEITMCPRDLFINQGADVRTSILILQKGVNFQGNIVVNNRCASIEEFKAKLDHSNKKIYKLRDIILSSKKDNYEFIIECPKDIKNLFNLQRIADKFKCISGISTGNDKEFLSYDRGDPFTIPFYKNPGKDKFFTEKIMYINKNFLDLGVAIPNFIVRNKEFIYKSGIICSSMGVNFSACKLPDGSTFGVNACIICDEEDLYWLLAYLNSTLVTYFVRGVLLRSNMITSGYVSRIPLLSFNEKAKSTLSKLGKSAYENIKENKDVNHILEDIDTVVNKEAIISNETINYINDFRNGLIKKT